MEEITRIETTANPTSQGRIRIPADYFDLAGGTSTGGYAITLPLLFLYVSNCKFNQAHLHNALPPCKCALPHQHLVFDRQIAHGCSDGYRPIQTALPEDFSPRIREIPWSEYPQINFWHLMVQRQGIGRWSQRHPQGGIARRRTRAAWRKCDRSHTYSYFWIPGRGKGLSETLQNVRALCFAMSIVLMIVRLDLCVHSTQETTVPFVSEHIGGHPQPTTCAQYGRQLAQHQRHRFTFHRQRYQGRSIGMVGLLITTPRTKSGQKPRTCLVLSLSIASSA